MITIRCRSTGAGAYTYVIHNRCIKVTAYDHSKTGNHWLESVEGQDGARFGVKDVSNSGKHNCWIGIIDSKQKDGYRIIQGTEPGQRCLICMFQALIQIRRLL
jgi:hypothetical protein